MKRISIAIAMMFLLVGSAKTTNPMVTRSLLASLQNERAAAVRYEAFAVRATEEGYLGVATLFRAEAKAERVHASRAASTSPPRIHRRRPSTRRPTISATR